MVVLVATVGCSRSGYRNIPLQQQASTATPQQQVEYGVSPRAQVLLEILPTSYRHETGPAGAFHYRPYEVVARCATSLVIEENWEYRRWLRNQSESAARTVHCQTGPTESALAQRPSRGDVVHL